MTKHINKIDKLIAELCPNGVDSIALGVLTTEQTKRNSTQSVHEVRSVTNSVGLVKTSDFFDNTRTSQNTSNYKVVEPDMIVYNPSRINVGSIARHKEAIQVIVSPMYIVININTNRLSPEYLELFLLSAQGKLKIINKIEVGARFRFTYLSFASIRLLLPPLAVQERIITILNGFTKLEIELEAELEARKKQYEYYRSELLKHKNTAKQVELRCVANYSKTRVDANSLNKECYVGVDNLLQNKQGKTISNYVPTTGKLTRYETDDILIGNIRPYLKKIWCATKVGGTNGDVLVVRINENEKNNLNSKFLYHLLASDNFFNYNMQFAKGAKMPRGDKSAIMKYKIPIPDIVEQKRIVSILDKFDVLVNDISVGLPAELSARRLQYEYYRNKLLSFKEYVQ